MSITKSKRNVYAACHLTAEAKDKLRKKAQLQHASISVLIAEAVEEKLEREEAINGRHAANQ